MSSEQKVFNTVTVTVSGLGGDIHVSGFELSVGINSVPSIMLDILPVQASSSAGTSASRASASGVVSLYNELAGKASTRFTGIGNETKATVSISVDRGGMGTDSIELKNWILTDVYLSTVTTASAPSLSVVLKHGIEVLERVGEIYEDVLTENPLKLLHQKDLGSSMVDIMDTVYSTFAEDVKYYKPYNAAGKSADKVVKFRKNIPNALPGKYLVPEGGVFLASAVGGVGGVVQEKIKIGIAMTAGSGFRESIWATVIQTLCPVCLAQVIPTYDKDTLILGPCSPWEEPRYLIPGDMIEAVDIASHDPDPLCGVAMKMPRTDIPASTDNDAKHFQNQNYSNPSALSNTFYIAEKAECGRIIQVPENRVIAIAKGVNMSFVKSDTVKVDAAEQTMSRSNVIAMGSCYAQGMFQSLYRRNCHASATTVLMFRDESGNVIYPGRVATIIADGRELATGYIARAIMRGTTNGNCTSTFDLIYARAPSSGDSLVAEGSKNPCYSN